MLVLFGQSHVATLERTQKSQVNIDMTQPRLEKLIPLDLHSKEIPVKSCHLTARSMIQCENHTSGRTIHHLVTLLVYTQL